MLCCQMKVVEHYVEWSLLTYEKSEGINNYTTERSQDSVFIMGNAACIWNVIIFKEHIQLDKVG